MFYMATLFNMGRTFRNRPATNYLAFSISAAGIPITSLFLTSQVPIKNATQRLIGIDMTVNRLMADWHFGSDLFGTPLNLQIALNR